MIAPVNSGSGRRWDWTRSLAGVDPDEDRTYRIRKIIFALVRDRCSQIGLETGQRLRCRRRTEKKVEVELDSGEVGQLELAYAWFVEIEAVDGVAQWS